MTAIERRKTDVAALARLVIAWTIDRLDVQAIALVGSWARNKPGTGPDVDFVVLTSTPQAYID